MFHCGLCGLLRQRKFWGSVENGRPGGVSPPFVPFYGKSFRVVRSFNPSRRCRFGNRRSKAFASRQAGYLSAGQHLDVRGGGHLRQAGHGYYVAPDDDNKAGTRREPLLNAHSDVVNKELSSTPQSQISANYWMPTR
jgi:hypothetical protein